LRQEAFFTRFNQHWTGSELSQTMFWKFLELIYKCNKWWFSAGSIFTEMPAVYRLSNRARKFLIESKPVIYNTEYQDHSELKHREVTQII
jgi:hypothetical protein